MHSMIFRSNLGDKFRESALKIVTERIFAVRQALNKEITPD